jgi:hypothetical protein
MMPASEASEDARALPGCDAGEVSQARQAAEQLLDRFRRIRSQEAIEPIAHLVRPREGSDGDG